MAKNRRKWTKVRPSAELLRWVEGRVMELLRVGDRSGPGKAYWTYITRHLEDDTTPTEWRGLSPYGQGKVVGQTVDRLKAQGILKRKKNFHPFILTNPLDRIVAALNKADAEEKKT